MHGQVDARPRVQGGGADWESEATTKADKRRVRAADGRVKGRTLRRPPAHSHGARTTRCPSSVLRMHPGCYEASPRPPSAPVTTGTPASGAEEMQLTSR